MWPLSITVGVGGRAIAVGTDASEVVTLLEAWRIDEVGDPTDFCLELYPPAAGRGEPQRVPGLYHGSTALLRSRDPVRLTTALRRVLSSYANPAGTGEVRVGLTPVVCHGVALLAPPATVAAFPERWLAARGIEAFAAVSTRVDARTAQVFIDAPLGSEEEPVTAALGGWWLPRQHGDGALSPGFAVAEVMALTTDITIANAASVLQAVAALVQRVQPVVAPGSVPAAKDRLLGAFDAAPAR